MAHLLQAYLLAIPIVNQAGMRDSIRKFGPDNQTDVIWEDLVDPRTVELTANDNTIYNFIWVDTSKGPLVAEIPPKVLGLVNDFWYKWVADVGITGATVLDSRGLNALLRDEMPIFAGQREEAVADLEANRARNFARLPPRSAAGAVLGRLRGR